jgi:signal recognition particle receptor subunit alpha
LEPLVRFKQHLISKNVALDVAQVLCEEVGSSLIGKNGNPNEVIKNELESCINKVLQFSTNILNEINAKKNVFTIVFCGVNGVGKSTSISKICFYLLQCGFSCLIAACDTFRSGAVEQLKVHVGNLSSLCDSLKGNNFYNLANPQAKLIKDQYSFNQSFSFLKT